jgi:WXG100 family type VII secretion target
MSTHFALNPAELDNLAGQLAMLHTTDANAIGQQLQRINTGLQSTWTGSSADAFATAFGDWTGKWQAICGNLTLVSAFLREAARQYRELEDARNRALGVTDSARWRGRAEQYSGAPGGGALTGDSDRYPPSQSGTPPVSRAAPTGGGAPVYGSGGATPDAGPTPDSSEWAPVAGGGGGAVPGPSAPPASSELPDPVLPGEQGDGLGPGARPHDPNRQGTSDYGWIFEPGPGGPLFGVTPELARLLSSEFKEWLAANGIYLEDLGKPLTFTPEQLRRLDQIWNQYGIDLPDDALREPLTLTPEQTHRFLEWADPVMHTAPVQDLDPNFDPATGRWWNGYTWVDTDPTPPGMLYPGGSNQFDERTGLWWTGEMWTDEPPTPRPDLPNSTRVGDAPYLGETAPDNARVGDAPYLGETAPDSTRVGDAPYLGEPLPDNGRTGDAPYLGEPLPGDGRTGDTPYLGEPLPDNGRTGDAPYLGETAPDIARVGDAPYLGEPLMSGLTREQVRVVEAWIRASARGDRGPVTWPGLEAS